MSNFIGPSSERAFKEAEAEGLEVVLPDDHTLQLDIDNDEDYDIYHENYPILEKYFKVLDTKEAPSRSGKGKHITILLHEELGVYERIALQAALGSDRKREILNMVQARSGDPHPILFLEKKEQKLLAQRATA
jgi:hypothetical protein